MSELVIKVLNIVSIILSVALVIGGGSIIFKNVELYDTNEDCQNNENSIFILILITIGIGFLGSIYKTCCCGLNHILFWAFHILNLFSLGYNLYILNNITEVCKNYYTDKYDGIWELFELGMIYQSMIICIGLINFVIYVLYKSICKDK